MEAEYKLKSKLFDAVTNRIQQVFSDGIEEELPSKTISFRVSMEEFEKIGNISQILQMNKSDFIRMVITNAIDDIIREYKIQVETIGLSHAESDELIEKLNSGDYELKSKEVDK